MLKITGSLLFDNSEKFKESSIYVKVAHMVYMICVKEEQDDRHNVEIILTLEDLMFLCSFKIN